MWDYGEHQYPKSLTMFSSTISFGKLGRYAGSWMTAMIFSGCRQPVLCSCAAPGTSQLQMLVSDVQRCGVVVPSSQSLP